MTNKLIKVDRVRSVEEAVALEEAGAGLIGVALDPHPAFADARVVSSGTAEAIGRSLSRARFVTLVDFRDDPMHAVRRALALGADLVQPITVQIPPPEARAALAAAGAGIVYADIEAAHDDDPSWILSRYTDVSGQAVAFFQAAFLPEYPNSWEFLRDESPEYEEELQIDDINALARTCPLLGALNVTPQNAAEIVAAFPMLQGFALTLADHLTRQDVRAMSFDQALVALRALRHAT